MRTFVILALLTATASAQPSPDHKFSRGGAVMGTNVNVTFWSDDEAKAAKAFADAMKELERLDKLMSHWVADSDVSKVNAAAGTEWVVVSAETFAVIERALDVSKKSNGLFDITVGALSGLWKFDMQNKDGSIPTDAQIKAARPLVGWKSVLLDKKKKAVKLKKKGMAINLGGIAKGYAVDRAVKILHDANLADFIVQVGGDLYVSGKKDADSWVVGIRDPRGKTSTPTGPEMFAMAPVEDRSFSTSGDYERTVVKDGKRYHHIIDPRTGKPATASRSVTVMAKDAFTADAWSKVLFIMGPKLAMPLVEKMPDFDAVFVDADNKVHVSSGLKDKLKIVHDPTPGL
jgi:thiamine biosynthesis lipoprotein